MRARIRWPLSPIYCSNRERRHRSSRASRLPISDSRVTFRRPFHVQLADQHLRVTAAAALAAELARRPGSGDEARRHFLRRTGAGGQRADAVVPLSDVHPRDDGGGGRAGGSAHRERQAFGRHFRLQHRLPRTVGVHSHADQPLPYLLLCGRRAADDGRGCDQRSRASMPLQLIAWLQGAGRRKYASHSLGPRLVDTVIAGISPEYDLRIDASRPKQWTKLTTIRYNDELFEVAKEMTGPFPHRYVYFLKRIPPGKVVRGLHDYDPEETLQPDSGFAVEERSGQRRPW